MLVTDIRKPCDDYHKTVGQRGHGICLWARKAIRMERKRRGVTWTVGFGLRWSIVNSLPTSATLVVARGVFPKVVFPGSELLPISDMGNAANKTGVLEMLGRRRWGHQKRLSNRASKNNPAEEGAPAFPEQR